MAPKNHLGRFAASLALFVGVSALRSASRQRADRHHVVRRKPRWRSRSADQQEPGHPRRPPFARALIGNPEIADVLPLTDQSLYVLGKKMGTTSLTLYDRRNMLIAVVDVIVGPDVIGLKRQLSELFPDSSAGARISNELIVLEGMVSSAVAADRAVQLAETYAPGKVVNMLSVGASQQVMLEVRFSEVKRSALKQIGAGFFVGNDSGSFTGAIGGGASLTPDATTGRAFWASVRSSTVSEF